MHDLGPWLSGKPMVDFLFKFLNFACIALRHAVKMHTVIQMVLTSIKWIQLHIYSVPDCAEFSGGTRDSKSCSLEVLRPRQLSLSLIIVMAEWMQLRMILSTSSSSSAEKRFSMTCWPNCDASLASFLLAFVTVLTTLAAGSTMSIISLYSTVISLSSTVIGSSVSSTSRISSDSSMWLTLLPSFTAASNRELTECSLSAASDGNRSSDGWRSSMWWQLQPPWHQTTSF